MDEFLQRVEQSILSRKLLRNGEAVLVAVSGGVDSMVLLHALQSLASKHGWVLTVAHFNHLLRGRAANADQRFVARVAKELIVPCECATADVRRFARAQKLSIEMAARTLRHQFFARRARDLGIKRVALAHHADDQVELFLLRLLRGASVGGLGGMHWSTKSPADDAVTLIRPLLDLRKDELATWAHEQNIAFREDVTNSSTDILRNRVRHKLLPLLRREYQPGIDSVLLRECQLLRDESDFVEAEAERALKARTKLEDLPVALQRRILRARLLRAGLDAEFQLVERLRRSRSAWVSVDANVLCRRDERGQIETRAASAEVFKGGELKMDVRSVNSATFDGTKISWVARPGKRLPARKACREFFDAEAVGESIVLRHWRAGDRFQPIGMKSPVKLQDLFTNQKIPRERRHRLVVATTAAGEIFWVEGLRIGERFKLKPATSQRLEWKWRRL